MSPVPAAAGAMRALARDVRRRWTFARHLKAHQVLRRMQLEARRRWRVRRPPDHTQAGAATALRQDLPGPLLPPRGGLERCAGGWRAVFLNRARTFAGQIDWQPAPGAPADQLWTMHLHYMEYLEALSDADFQALVEDWLARNPPYRPGYWRDVWNSYTISLRVVVWLQQLASRRDRLDDRLIARMAAASAQQLDFLHQHLELDLGGNHLIKNIKALLWGARAFALPAARRWRRTAEALLERELALQILPDGVHYERSPSYHCQVLADLLECFQVMAPGPLRSELEAALERMAAAAADLAHPDGYVALFNDAGLHMAYAPGDCLEACRRAAGIVVAPTRHVRRAAAGYYGLRAAGNYALFDCGPIAPDWLVAHGHGDILSFEWSLGGRRIVVDPGVFEYVAGARRTYARSSASHNTVTVDGAEQCDFFGAFRCGRRARPQLRACAVTAAGGLELEGTHDGFDHLPGRPRHVRTVVVSPAADALEIVDRIAGAAGSACMRVLLHPACTLEVVGCRALIRRDDVVIEVLAERAITVERAHWSPDLGLWLETLRLAIRFERVHRLVLRRQSAA